MKRYLFTLFLLASSLLDCAALDNGQGITPKMGLNPWYQFSGTNAAGTNITGWSATTISNTADAFCNLGFTNYGYRLIQFDAGWQSGRDGAGEPVPSAAVFPGGLIPLLQYVHNRGLLLGLYFNKGTNGDFVYTNVGSYGWHSNDLSYAASNSFDAVKCDLSSGFTSPYSTLTSAGAYYNGWLLTNNSTKLYLQQGDGQSAPGTTYPTLCNAWRLAGDVMSPGNALTFAVITNRFYAAVASASASGPGYENDLDMVLVGYTNNPYYGPITMTAVESRSQFSLWCMAASPLILSCNVSNLTAAQSAILTNRDLISIDQDPLVLCCTNAGSYFVKPLADGSYAVGFLNIGATTNRVSINFSSLGLPNQTMVHDCWNQTDIGVFSGGFAAYVAPHDFSVYKLRNPLVTESFSRTLIASYPTLPNNLVGWYDASTIQAQNGATITNWPDLSPGGTNSLQVNTIDSANPVLSTAAQNGLNVLNFSGLADNGTGLLATNANSMPGQFDVFIVFQTTNSADSQSLVGWNTVSSGTAALGIYGPQQQTWDRNIAFGQTLIGTQWCVYRWSLTTNLPADVQSGQARNHFLNGRLDAAFGVNPNPTSVTGLYIGTDYSNHSSNPMAGSIAEIRIYNVILTPAQAKLETAKLGQKWGITVAQ